MTTQHAVISTPLARRSRLGLVRDLVVVGLCTLVVGGFLLGVDHRGGPTRPAAASGETASS